MSIRITTQYFFAAFFCLALLAFTFPAVAQTNYEDGVYLKNGNIVRGMIIEQIPNQSITIKTADKSIFVFKMDEILKITKEEVAPQVPAPIYVPVPSDKSDLAYSRDQPEEKKVIVTEPKAKGYVNILEITWGRDILQNHSHNAITGSTVNTPVNFSQFSVGVQDINGYRFNSQFSTGVGFGVHLYPGLVYLPLFADFRFHFNKHGISPYMNVAIGYSFAQMEILGYHSTKDYYGGLLVNPAFGFRFPVHDKFSFIMSFGYRYQQAKIYTHNSIFGTNNPYASEYYQGYTLGYMNVKMGFEF